MPEDVLGAGLEPIGLRGEILFKPESNAIRRQPRTIGGVSQKQATQETNEKTKKTSKGFFESLAIVRFVKWCCKHDVVPLGFDVYNFSSAYYSTYTTAASTSNMVMKFVKNFFKLTEDFWTKSQFITHVYTVAKFASAAMTPRLIMDMYGGFTRMFTKDNLSKQIDGALTVLDAQSGLAGNAVTIGEGLHYTGTISKAVLDGLAPLNIISLALFAAGIGASAKSWYETNAFVSQAKKEIETADGKVDWEKAVNALVDTKGNGLKKHVKMKRQEVRDKIDAIKKWASEIKAEDILKKEKWRHITKDQLEEYRRQAKDLVLEKAYHAIVERAQARSVTHQLATVSGIGMMTGGSLLTAGVSAPVGFGFLAFGSGISIVKYVQDKLSTKYFKEALVPPSLDSIKNN